MKKKETIKIRKAKVGDVPAMHRLLNYFAERRELLPRALSELYENLQQFFVAEAVQGQVAGCCSVYVTWQGLAELKALAVAPEFHGQGIGSRLVRTCLAEARTLGVEQVFSLVIRNGFFERFGFRRITKDQLPYKVWSECVRCPFFPEHCIETAVILDLVKRKKKTPARRQGLASWPVAKGTSEMVLPAAVVVPSEPLIPGPPTTSLFPEPS